MTSRPGGRSARVRDAVHAAAVDLLVAGEFDATIPQIAERAGVNPTSVYRRWGNRENLLLDAAVARLRATWPIPDTGSLHGDLSSWAAGVERSMLDPGGRILLRALVAAITSGHQPAQYLAGRGDDLQAMLDRAPTRGEQAPPVQEILDHILAPLYLRALFGLPLEPGTGATLVNRLLRDYSS
jgi:AcrR family transcriptional regulator